MVRFKAQCLHFNHLRVLFPIHCSGVQYKGEIITIGIAPKWKFLAKTENENRATKAKNWNRKINYKAFTLTWIIFCALPNLSKCELSHLIQAMQTLSQPSARQPSHPGQMAGRWGGGIVDWFPCRSPPLRSASLMRTQARPASCHITTLFFFFKPQGSAPQRPGHHGQRLRLWTGLLERFLLAASYHPVSAVFFQSFWWPDFWISGCNYKYINSG